MSINNNIKFLEKIKQGFKRTISWNKYRSERTAQPKNNNLDYLIDPINEINFNEKLEEDDGATTLFVSEKQKKTILKFSLDSLIVAE